jgi:hypothetical protein
MNKSLIRLERWLHKDAAELLWAPGRETVMAKMIQFHVPAGLQPVKTRWAPAKFRGKVIDFRVAATRKPA